MNAEFWHGKRVLLTGHTGFKGAWLTLWLRSLGARVTGFSLAPEGKPNLYEAANAGLGIDSIIGDLRDPTAVDAAVSRADPDILLHLAAQALVRRSYADPIGTYATNVMGTVHLLDAVRRRSKARAVVVVTTDKCYENREWVWAYREDESMGGHDPYSSSKGCAELVTAAFRRSYFAASTTGIASARAGNVIGGGDWSQDRLIADLIRGFSDGRAVLIRNPESVRPWQHVLDALSGYLLLAEKLHDDPRAFADAFNFGPSTDETVTVRYIADRLVARWGSGACWTQDTVSGPHEAHHLKLDSSKARHALSWRPRLPLDQALDWIVDWHCAHAAGHDMATFTRRQLGDYLALWRAA